MPASDAACTQAKQQTCNAAAESAGSFSVGCAPVNQSDGHEGEDQVDSVCDD